MSREDDNKQCKDYSHNAPIICKHVPVRDSRCKVGAVLISRSPTQGDFYRERQGKECGFDLQFVP